uniref:Uncharacterized protein n=1 Tax=Glossina pallidipes TaxID=7398 RepID=A0A1A9ZW18_GLOPL
MYIFMFLKYFVPQQIQDFEIKMETSKKLNVGHLPLYIFIPICASSDSLTVIAFLKMETNTKCWKHCVVVKKIETVDSRFAAEKKIH